MIVQNLPVLHVVIPMVAAALCALVRKGNYAWLISITATFFSFLICIALLLKTFDNGAISYYMGNWGRPESYDYTVGIEYNIDRLNSLILLLISFVGFAMLPYARRSIRNELDSKKVPLFYTLYLLCFSGLLGIISTNDIFNIYVFIEISSLSTYTMIALGRDKRAMTSSFEYLIMGTIGATFILIGVGLLYMMIGTLNLSDMAENIKSVENTRPIEAAFAFITLGLAMKIALFPLHIWLTNAYAYAPSAVSAFLSSTATKVMIYVFIRIIYSLFGLEFAFEHMPLAVILVTLSIMGIIVGSVSAIYQPNIKRMLAFSSVAQLGYIALALGLYTETGLAAAIVHLVNHSLAKGLLFLCVGAVYMRVGGVRIEYFAGVAKSMPLTMFAFVIGGLSLIGVPLTAGFISKWYLIYALIEKGWWPLIILLLISSALAIIYIWRVVEAAYFQSRPKNAKKIKEAPVLMLVSIYILAFSNIYFGINTDLTLGLSIEAANQLFYAGVK